MLKLEDTNQEDFHLMSKEEDVRPVQEMDIKKLKCNFYLMLLFPVRFVMELDITAKHLM